MIRLAVLGAMISPWECGAESSERFRSRRRSGVLVLTVSGSVGWVRFLTVCEAKKDSDSIFVADTSRIASRVLVGHRAQAGRCMGTIPPAPEVAKAVVMIMIRPDGKGWAFST